MTDIVSTLTTSLTSATFFGAVADLMPFVVVMVPFSLGLTLLRRVIKGAGKGKVSI